MTISAVVNQQLADLGLKQTRSLPHPLDVIGRDSDHRLGLERRGNRRLGNRRLIKSVSAGTPAKHNGAASGKSSW